MGYTESMAREAACGTVDTEVTAKTLGTTTAEDIIVPKHKEWITGIVVCHATDGAAAGTSAGVLILRGDGVERQQQIPMGAFGAELTSTNGSPAFATFIPTNIKAVGGASIEVRMLAVGEDTGTPQNFCQLIFDSSPRPGFLKMQYVALEVQGGTVDTWVQLQSLGGGAASTYLVPGDAKVIKQILLASQADCQAVGAGTIAFRFYGNGIIGSCQVIGNGAGGTHTAEANGHSGVLIQEHNQQVDGGNRITGEAIMIGVDIGTVVGCAALGFGY